MDSFNGRERDPYPDDYEETLHAHAVWQAEETNRAILAKLERAKSQDLNACYRLIAIDLDPPSSSSKPDDAQQARIQRGRTDGRNLVYGLAMERNLSDCLVEVPQWRQPARQTRRVAATTGRPRA